MISAAAASLDDRCPGPRPSGSPARRVVDKAATAWRELPVKRRRWLLIGWLLIAGIDGLYLLVTHEPFLVWYASRFRVEDPLITSDAIVLLLGGPADRPARAAELYHRGLAPVILIGRSQEEARFDTTEMSQQALLDRGVPAEAIVVLPGEAVKSTYTEACRVRDYARGRPIHKLIVVTTAYHTARASWTYRNVLKHETIDIRMAPSEDSRWTETNWFETQDGLKVYLLESLKSIYYRLAY